MAAQRTPVINLPAANTNPERRPDRSEKRARVFSCSGGDLGRQLEGSSSPKKRLNEARPSLPGVRWRPQLCADRITCGHTSPSSYTRGNAPESGRCSTNSGEDPERRTPSERQITGLDKLHSDCDHQSRLDVGFFFNFLSCVYRGSQSATPFP